MQFWFLTAISLFVTITVLHNPKQHACQTVTYLLEQGEKLRSIDTLLESHFNGTRTTSLILTTFTFSGAEFVQLSSLWLFKDTATIQIKKCQMQYRSKLMNGKLRWKHLGLFTSIDETEGRDFPSTTHVWYLGTILFGDYVSLEVHATASTPVVPNLWAANPQETAGLFQGVAKFAWLRSESCFSTQHLASCYPHKSKLSRTRFNPLKTKLV
jgi:hypothetical protein